MAAYDAKSKPAPVNLFADSAALKIVKVINLFSDNVTP
jgi:hypothetical protein